MGFQSRAAALTHESNLPPSASAEGLQTAPFPSHKRRQADESLHWLGLKEYYCVSRNGSILLSVSWHLTNRYAFPTRQAISFKSQRFCLLKLRNDQWELETCASEKPPGWKDVVETLRKVVCNSQILSRFSNLQSDAILLKIYRGTEETHSPFHLPKSLGFLFVCLFPLRKIPESVYKGRFTTSEISLFFMRKMVRGCYFKDFLL